MPHVELSNVVVEESPPIQAVPEMTNDMLANRRKARLREVFIILLAFSARNQYYKITGINTFNLHYKLMVELSY